MRRKLNIFWTVLTRQRSSLRGSWFEYLVVFLSFLLLTFFYTNWTIANINSQIFTTSTGDATSGFVWLIDADDDWNPLWAYTDKVNFPEGEQLGSPLYVTWTLLFIPLWLLSKVFSPVASLNIVTYLGFMSCAMSMYWLMKRLTGKWYVAMFAAFAATFFPYHLFKSSGHLANLFSWVFVAITASFLYAWEKRTHFSSFLLALSVAAAFYTDGYFLLIASVFTALLGTGGILSDIFTKKRQQIWLGLRTLLVAGGLVTVLALPIVLTQLFAGQQASNELRDVRGNIKEEVQYYSAQPIDYFIPSLHSPFFEGQQWYDEAHKEKATRSNTAESALYIGYVVIALCIIGLVLAGTYVLRAKYSNLARIDAIHRRRFLLVTVLTVIAVPACMALMLPLEVGAFGRSIPTPADILTDYVEFWRVFARFILPVHVLLVIFAAFTLFVLSRLLRPKWRPELVWASIAIVLTLITAAEYATTVHRPSFSLDNLPSAYTWLKQQDDINSIVELPLVDRPVETAGYYATAQLVHGKKLLNNHLAASELGERNVFGLGSNQETIDYILARDIDAVITRDDVCRGVEWGVIAHQGDVSDARLPGFEQIDYKKMCVYKVTAGEPEDGSFMRIRDGIIGTPAVQNGKYLTYLQGNYAEFSIANELGEPIKNERAIMSLLPETATPQDDDKFSWRILQNDKVIAVGNINGEPISVTVDTDAPIQLRVNTISGDNPEPGQITIRNYSSTLLRN